MEVKVISENDHAFSKSSGISFIKSPSPVSILSANADPKTKRDFNKSAYNSLVFRILTGVFPDDHPATQYVRTLFTRLQVSDIAKHCRVFVCDGMNDINACAFFNGDIYVSKELVQFCDFAEELLYVLGHELAHIEKEHENALNDPAHSSFLSDIGALRAREYRADVSSFLGLDQCGVNPHGGIIFCQKMVARSKLDPAGPDMAHGSDLDRLVNLFWSTRYKDLPTISYDTNDLSPVPKNIHGLCAPPPKQYLLKTGNSVIQKDIRHPKDLTEAIVLYHDLYHRTFSYSRKAEEDAKERLTVLEAYIKEKLTLLLPASGYTQELLNAAFFIIMDLTCEDTYLNNRYDPSSDTYKKVFKQVREPILLIDLLRKDIITALGLTHEKTPETVSETIFHGLLQGTAFENSRGNFKINEYLSFCQEYVTAMGDMYDQHASVELSRTELFTELTMIALNVSGLVAKAFVNKVKKGAWVLFDEAHALDILTDEFDDEPEADKGSSPREQEKTLTYLQRIDTAQLNNKKMVCELLKNFHRFLKSSPKEFNAQHAFLLAHDHTLLSTLMSLSATELASVLPYWELFYTEAEEQDIYWDSIDTIPFRRHFYERIVRPTVQNIPNAVHLIGTLTNYNELYEHDIHCYIYDDPLDILHIIKDHRALCELTNALAANKHAYELNGLLLFAFYHITASDIANGTLSKEECFERVSWAAQNLKIMRDEQVSDTRYMQIWGSEISTAQFKTNMLRTANYLFLNTLLKTYTWDMSDTEEHGRLLQLVDLIYDRTIAYKVKNHALKLFAQKGTFEDIRTLIFNKGSYDAELLDHFIEDMSRTPAQLEQVREELQDLEKKEELFEKGAGLLMLEQAFSSSLYMNKIKLLTILLGTHIQDEDIKKVLYELIKKNRFSLEDFTEERAPNSWTPAIRQLTAEDYLMDLYNTSDLQKNGLTRMLLIETNGILLKKESRRKLLEYILSDLIGHGSNTEEKELFKIIQEVLEAFFLHGSTELLYLLIAPLISKWLLIPPGKNGVTEWESIVRADMFPDAGYSYEDDETEYISDEAWSKFNDMLAACQHTPDSFYTTEDLVHNDILMELTGNSPLRPSDTKREKMSPVSLVVEIAKNLGSLGVRFLQVLGQYVHIPDAYREEFDSVYDGVQGQVKLTSYETLLREWPTFAEEVSEISASIGGGSMMTAYRVTFRDGHTEVVKVANPNLVYTTEQLSAEMKKIFKVLIQRKGAAYAVAEVVLDDITEWIKQDFSYEHFLPENQQFYASQNGYRHTHSDRYQIKVPQAYGQDNHYHKREEHIEGIGLTKKHEQDLLAKGHDLKQIVRAIGHSYIKQILDGRVHSDVHIGNFLVTDNDECAILDRNFYVELDNADKGFIFNIALAHTDTAKTVDTVMNYFMPDTDGTRSEEKETLKKELQELLLQKAGADIPEKLSAMMVFLHEKNIPIPLKITLLVKNLNGLDKMAKAAGYNGLIDILL